MIPSLIVVLLAAVVVVIGGGGSYGCCVDGMVIRPPPQRGIDGMVRNYVKMDHVKLQSIVEEPNGMIWIDVENVRGKSGFDLSHIDVLERVTIWTKHYGLEGKVNLVVDHGTITCGYWLQERGLGICFAGPRQKADDVISHDVSLFNAPAIVVTADNELQQRCRRAIGRHSLHIMPPAKFLTDLEQVMMQVDEGRRKLEELLDEKEEKVIQYQQQQEGTEGDDKPLDDDQILLGNMDAEIRLGGQLLEARAMLRNKKNITNKRKKKIQKRIQSIQEKLARKGPSTLNRVTSLLSAPSSPLVSSMSSSDNDDDDDISRKEQNVLLERWLEIRNKSPRREQTGDRIILAERLRRHLIDSGEVDSNDEEGEEMDDDEEYEGKFPVKAHVRHMNGYMSPAEIQSVTSKTLQDRNRKTKADSSSSSSTSSSISSSSILSTYDPSIVNMSSDSSTTSTIKRGPSTRDALFPPKNTTTTTTDDVTTTKTLKLVVVSDTHGFETQFADQGKKGIKDDILPDGDILLHLGDFAMDGTSERCYEGLVDFDAWLARQPHRYKIVLRGNHDPWHFDFAQSGSWYVTKPQTATIANLVFAFVPYGSSRKLASAQGIPNRCDVFASHVPPFKDLDRCLTGRHAGSGFLTRIVRGMASGGQPHLWLCGHIHEARGIKTKRFGKGKSGRDTIIINAANANSGAATHLDYGPVVLQLDSSKGSKRNNGNEDDDEDVVEIIQMDDKSIGRGTFVSQSKFFQPPSSIAGEDFRELLLAVDLGLKSGISLFNDRGELVRYEQFHFETTEHLEESAIQIIQEWQDEANNKKPHQPTELSIDDDPDDSNNVTPNDHTDSDITQTTLNSHDNNDIPWRVTHIAIEGADPGLREAWSNAAQRRSLDDNSDRPISLLRISPEEWRSHLLTKKEMTSGFNAKAAARLIARQVVSDYGTMEVHQGKFHTDMAESVVMGIYVARKLGWVKREPAVRRYTNDGIVVPKKL